MSNKIIPTSGQKRIFFIHCLVFAVANIAMWMLYKGNAKGWVYPWPAWITAAWALAIIGHMCALWTSYEDAGMKDYERQTQNG
jgi:cation transport ATPase